jgi:hypothetical protein
MSKTKYDLDSMINAFKEHAEEAEKRHKEMVEKFPESDWNKNDFNIALALHHICKQIKEINDVLYDITKDRL